MTRLFLFANYFKTFSFPDKRHDVNDFLNKILLDMWHTIIFMHNENICFIYFNLIYFSFCWNILKREVTYVERIWILGVLAKKYPFHFACDFFLFPISDFIAQFFFLFFFYHIDFEFSEKIVFWLFPFPLSIPP